MSSSAVVTSLAVQIQMITGSSTRKAPICTIESSSTMKASRPALGTAASLKPMPASSACTIATPITPCATARMVAPAEPQEMLALFGHDAKQEAAAGRNQPRPVRKQEAGHEHRDQELERADAGVARKPDNGPASGWRYGATSRSTARMLL